MTSKHFSNKLVSKQFFRKLTKTKNECVINNAVNSLEKG